MMNEKDSRVLNRTFVNFFLEIGDLGLINDCVSSNFYTNVNTWKKHNCTNFRISLFSSKISITFCENISELL